MKIDDFLQEALRSPSCPKDFSRIFDDFRTYQEASKRTLVEFHRVCELNGVNYQLAYGSLIGAVRDGGQVPWDYDVDVFVPYDEKDKLIGALDKDLSDEYYYLCPESDPKCRHFIMRLAPVEYRSEAIHVDVFFLIGVPQYAPKRREFQERIARLSSQRYGQFVDIKLESLGSPRRYLSLLIKKRLPALLSDMTKVDEEYERLCRAYPFEESTICSPADIHATWYDYPTTLLRETELIETDFGEFRIPVHYDELLTYIYGDYLRIPNLESRIKEVIHSQKRISRIQQERA